MPLFSKNKISLPEWLLVAERHLVQALEVYSGKPVRLITFSATTCEKAVVNYVEYRALTLEAIGWVGNIQPKISAYPTLWCDLPRYPHFWKVRESCFALCLEIAPSKKSHRFTVYLEYPESIFEEPGVRVVNLHDNNEWFAGRGYHDRQIGVPAAEPCVG